MSGSSCTLADLATVIRSKNAGPFILTLDVFFKDEETFEKVKNSGHITRTEIAKAYGIKESDVVEMTFFEPAHVLKVSVKRWIGSGTPGDTDVFGAQQHVPLMEMKVTL